MFVIGNLRLLSSAPHFSRLLIPQELLDLENFHTVKASLGASAFFSVVCIEPSEGL